MSDPLGSSQMNSTTTREEDTIAHEGDSHQAVGVEYPQQHVNI